MTVKEQALQELDKSIKLCQQYLDFVREEQRWQDYLWNIIHDCHLNKYESIVYLETLDELGLLE